VVAEHLRGRDLRGLSLGRRHHPGAGRLARAPKKTPGRAHKIATLKALYAWLRRERHLLTSAEDPTVDLAVPQSSRRSARMQKERTPEQVQLVVAELDPSAGGPGSRPSGEVDLDQVRHMTDYRPHLRLAASTGWHVTELHRFASGAHPRAGRDAGADGTAAILETMHKNGEVFRTRVGPVGAAAARELLEAAASRSSGTPRR
jgi:hypothetical protein